jgi:hypothetical protein
MKGCPFRKKLTHMLGGKKYQSIKKMTKIGTFENKVKI